MPCFLSPCPAYSYEVQPLQAALNDLLVKPSSKLCDVSILSAFLSPFEAHDSGALLVADRRLRGKVAAPRQPF